MRDEEGFENLANAIIEHYRRALRLSLNGMPCDCVINECERFFRSEFFRELTEVDGEFLIKTIRKEFGTWRKEIENED